MGGNKVRAEVLKRFGTTQKGKIRISQNHKQRCQLVTFMLEAMKAFKSAFFCTILNNENLTHQDVKACRPASKALLMIELENFYVRYVWVVLDGDLGCFEPALSVQDQCKVDHKYFRIPRDVHWPFGPFDMPFITRRPEKKTFVRPRTSKRPMYSNLQCRWWFFLHRHRL